MRSLCPTFLLLCAISACNSDGGEAAGGTDGGTGSETGAATEPEVTGDSGASCADVDCGDNEVCDPETLACVCAEGAHECAGACVDSSSVDHCGDACSPCPDDPNGAAACVEESCTLTCDEGFAACDTGCCAADTGVIWDGDGAGASITTDDAHAPHVSFLADINVLSYAHLRPSGWVVEMIGGDNTQQRPTAIALDNEGQPIIAYRGSWAIQIARPDGDGWTHEEAYSSASGYGPVVGSRGLAVDSAGVPHVVAEQQSESGGNSNSDIWHLWWDGEQWQRESVATAFDNRYTLPSIVIDADDTLHVGWVSFFDTAVNYATKGPNATDGWTHVAVLDNASCCDDAHIALGGGAAPFVAYEAVDIGFAVADGSAEPWTFQAMRDPVGVIGDIGFDAAGELVYSMELDGDVILGRPNAGAWDEETLFSGAVGFMMTLDAVDGAHVVASAETALRYAFRP